MDPYARYKHGEPSERQRSKRGSYIKTSQGYFDVIPSATEWINAPSNGVEANIEYRSRYEKHTDDSRDGVKTIPMLKWKVIRPIKKEDEILAEYGGYHVEDQSVHELESAD